MTRTNTIAAWIGLSIAFVLGSVCLDAVIHRPDPKTEIAFVVFLLNGAVFATMLGTRMIR